MCVDIYVFQAFEFCLADDPRSAAGVGADNMTLVIVALKDLNTLQRDLEAEEERAYREGLSSDAAMNKEIKQDEMDVTSASK